MIHLVLHWFLVLSGIALATVLGLALIGVVQQWISDIKNDNTPE